MSCPYDPELCLLHSLSDSGSESDEEMEDDDKQKQLQLPSLMTCSRGPHASHAVSQPLPSPTLRRRGRERRKKAHQPDSLSRRCQAQCESHQSASESDPPDRFDRRHAAGRGGPSPGSSASSIRLDLYAIDDCLYDVLAVFSLPVALGALRRLCRQQ